MAALALALSAHAQVLNEVLYDTQGTDDPNLLYTEIWGASGTDLTGWSLVGINGNNGTAYRTIVLAGMIPADGYFVVGNSASVPQVDQSLNLPADAGIDWQNAGSSSGDDCDGIDLRNASGATVDHVCYGPCANPGNCEGEGGTNAPDPFPSQGINKAIARIPDHSDTDNNGTDFVVSETLTPGQPNSGVPCEPLTTTITELRNNDATGVPTHIGQFVVVSGVVGVNNYTLDSLTESSFYVQDDDAGINVFRGSVPAGIIHGSRVTVSGWVGQFNGLTEILSSGSGNCLFDVEITGSGNAPDPVFLQCNSAFEPFEGMLAQINGVTIVGGDLWPSAGSNANVDITDGTGVFTLRIDQDSEVDGTPRPQGAFTVVGIITQFDASSPYTEGYQITVRYPADIITTAVDEHGSTLIAEGFSLLGSYPNPFNSTARIRYEVGAARDLTLTIFDLMGREVAHETLSNLNPGTHEYVWNPTGSSGLYLVKLSDGLSLQSAKILYLK
jgi:hypothetical protein